MVRDGVVIIIIATVVVVRAVQVQLHRVVTVGIIKQQQIPSVSDFGLRMLLPCLSRPIGPFQQGRD